MPKIMPKEKKEQKEQKALSVSVKNNDVNRTEASSVPDKVPDKASDTCVVHGCVELRTMNRANTAFIKMCHKHAEEHRTRCQASYRRRLSRNQAIGQQKMTIEDLKSALTDERIAVRRLRKRLENVQKEHDTFVATVTSTSASGTPQGDNVIMSVLQKLHSSMNELIVKTENEESYKRRLKDMESTYDKLLVEKEALQEKVAHIKGQLLTQKQMMDLCMPRKK